MTDPRSLWEDLKRRRVVRAVAIYAVVGWGVFEVFESVAPILGLPDWVLRVVLLALLLGFPLVAGLAWAFDVDRSGVQRAEASGHRGRMWIAVGGAAAIAAPIGLYTVSTLRPPDASELDRSTVAVAPFRANMGAELAYLGDGMVDLLTVRLAEEEGLRPIDPSSMFAALGERTAPPARDELSRLAGRLGAGRMLSGSITGPVPGITITAELADVGGGEGLTQQTVTGSIDSLPALVDRLVSGLLSIEAGEREERVRYLAGSPAEAVRDYLRGRSLYRKGDYNAATEAFLAAIRVDTTFALAGMALSNAAGMLVAAPPFAAALGNRTAWNHQDRLPPADREFLRYVVGADYPEPRSDLARIREGQEAVERFPDRIEAWYLHADRVFHEGPAVGIEEEWAIARRGFERMLSMDPNHVVALQHRFWQTLLAEEPDSVAQRTARRLLEASTSPAIRWEASSFLGIEPAASIEASLGDQTIETLISILFVQALPWNNTIRSDHALGTRVVEEIGTRGGATSLAPFTFTLEMNRGRIASAERQLALLEGRGGDPTTADQLRVLGALYADGDRGAAQAAALRLARGATDPPGSDPPLRGRARDACLAGLWFQDRGMGDAAAGSLETLRGLRPGSAGVRAEIEGCVRLLEAGDAVARGSGDAAERVAALDAWALPGPPMLPALQGALDLAIGRMYRALGDLEGARRSFALCCHRHPNRMLTKATANRELGEVALELGDVETARRAFTYYARVRDAADPALQPGVAEARRQLRRLEGNGEAGGR